MYELKWHKITKHQDAPTTCGVYQYWKNKELLYIGKAVNLKARLSSHAQNAKLDPKERAIVEGRVIKYALCDSEFKALILESELIRTHKPPYNRVWKDDKSYLYIVIDLGDPFPRPRYARAHDLKLDPKYLAKKSKYKVFGPFPSSHIAEELLRAIRRLIPFCMSKNIGKRACFYSRIGLCNPCPSGDYKDQIFVKKQYRKQIRQVIKILEGQTDPVINSLTLEMKRASAKEDFETALSIRIKLERFERFISFHNFTDRHFSYNDADTKLTSLQNSLSSYLGVLHLGRIECYDASNSGLQDSTVSMVVMNQGLLDKGEYRRFKIKNPRARSDFDRLNEALTRRLKRLSRDDDSRFTRPDLIVIDGGVPQLRSLQRIFDQFPEPPNYLGIAKRPERLVIPATDGFATLKLSKNDPGLQLLIQLRDEAHRFANDYRKLLAKKRIGL